MMNLFQSGCINTWAREKIYTYSKWETLHLIILGDARDVGNKRGGMVKPGGKTAQDDRGYGRGFTRAVHQKDGQVQMGAQLSGSSGGTGASKGGGRRKTRRRRRRKRKTRRKARRHRRRRR